LVFFFLIKKENQKKRRRGVWAWVVDGMGCGGKNILRIGGYFLSLPGENEGTKGKT
jgi:hypothetical protein